MIYATHASVREIIPAALLKIFAPRLASHPSQASHHTAVCALRESGTPIVLSATGSYLPPVFVVSSRVGLVTPPQTIISSLVQTAVWPDRGLGASSCQSGSMCLSPDYTAIRRIRFKGGPHSQAVVSFLQYRGCPVAPVLCWKKGKRLLARSVGTMCILNAALGLGSLTDQARYRR
jgi:hypothetical protein